MIFKHLDNTLTALKMALRSTAKSYALYCGLGVCFNKLRLDKNSKAIWFKVTIEKIKRTAFRK